MLFSTEGLVSALNNKYLSKTMYHAKFENSGNRRFTIPTESFQPDLFPRLYWIQAIQLYHKQGPGNKLDIVIF